MRRLWSLVFMTVSGVIMLSAVPGMESKRFGGGGSSRRGGSSSGSGGRGSSNKNNQGSSGIHDTGVSSNSGNQQRPSAPVDHFGGSQPKPSAPAGPGATQYGWNLPNSHPVSGSFGQNAPSYGWNVPNRNTQPGSPGATHYGWNQPNSNPASGSVGQNVPSYGWNVPNRNTQPGSIGGNHGSNAESRYPSQQYPNQHFPSRQYPNQQYPGQSFSGGYDKSGYDGQRYFGGSGISNWNSGGGYKQPKGDWGWLGSAGTAYALSKHKGPKWGGGFGGGFGMPLIVPVPVPIVHHYRERPGWRGKVAQSIEPEGDIQGQVWYTWVNTTRQAPACFVTSRGVPCNITSYSCNVSSARTCNSTAEDCVTVSCSVKGLKCHTPSKERLCRGKPCYSPFLPVRCNITSFTCNVSYEPSTCNTSESLCNVSASAVPCNVTTYVCGVAANAWQAISNNTSDLETITNTNTNGKNAVDNVTLSKSERISHLHFKPHHSVGERVQCNISTVTCNVSRNVIQCNSTNGHCNVSSNKLKCSVQIVLCNLTAMSIPCNVTKYFKVPDPRVVTVESSNTTDTALSKIDTITSTTVPVTVLIRVDNETEMGSPSVLTANRTDSELPVNTGV